MKEIKDYLHFYLGCEIRYTPLQREYFDETLTGIHDNKLFTENDDNYACDIDSAKPILRPLSDITRDERREAAKLYENAYDEAGNVEGGELVINCCLIASAASSKYLLSKHFDLFGLIECGLAIDKSTLP